MKLRPINLIEGFGELYRTSALFDQQVSDFKETGIRYPISVRDTAFLRLNSEYSQGTRTCHANVLMKDSPGILVRVSPLVSTKNKKMLEQAVEAHKNYNYPVFNKSVYEHYHQIAEQDKTKKPEQMRAMFFYQQENHQITKEANESRFLFKDQREGYFNEKTNGEINVWQVNQDEVNSDGTIVNFLWFHWVEDGSYLSFLSRSLGIRAEPLGG